MKELHREQSALGQMADPLGLGAALRAGLEARRARRDPEALSSEWTDDDTGESESESDTDADLEAAVMEHMGVLSEPSDVEMFQLPPVPEEMGSELEQVEPLPFQQLGPERVPARALPSFSDAEAGMPLRARQPSAQSDSDQSRVSLQSSASSAYMMPLARASSRGSRESMLMSDSEAERRLFGSVRGSRVSMPFSESEAESLQRPALAGSVRGSRVSMPFSESEAASLHRRPLAGSVASMASFGRGPPGQPLGRDVSVSSQHSLAPSRSAVREHFPVPREVQAPRAGSSVASSAESSVRSRSSVPRRRPRTAASAADDPEEPAEVQAPRARSVASSAESSVRSRPIGEPRREFRRAPSRRRHRQAAVFSDVEEQEIRRLSSEVMSAKERADIEEQELIEAVRQRSHDIAYHVDRMQQFTTQ